MSPEEGSVLRPLGGSARDGRASLVVSLPTEYAAPSLFHDERAAILFDGELHDHAELLRALGTDAAALNPAATVGRAYERWGADLCRHLTGEYSLLVWDARERELVCVRDRMGIFPFFFSVIGDTFWASRSITALTREPAVPGEVDRAVLTSHLRHSWPDKHETYSRAVKRLPPARRLKFTEGRCVVERYWDPVPTHGALGLADNSVTDFDPSFERAIRRRWQAGATGVFLSGGLDSVSIAAVGRSMARQDNNDPLALCLYFPEEESSEESVQRGVATQLGIEARGLDFDEALAGRDFIAAGLEWSSRLSIPLCNHWWPVYSQLALVGRDQGCDVILTGMGGDEWLGVSPEYAADLMRGGGFGRLRQLLTATVNSFRLPAWRMVPRVLWGYGAKLLLRRSMLTTMMRMEATPGLRSVGRRLIRAYQGRGRRIAQRNIPDWLAPDPELRSDIAARAEARVATTLRATEDFYLAEMRRGLDHFLVNSQFEESFEVETQLGVRMRHPFLDPQLVEALCQVPPEALNEGGWSKALLRQSLARRFPDLGFDRQKKLLATDFWQSRFLATGAAAWQELGGPQRLAELGVVDASAAERFREEVLREQRRVQVYRLWDILNLETWVRGQS